MLLSDHQAKRLIGNRSKFSLILNSGEVLLNSHYWIRHFGEVAEEKSFLEYMIQQRCLTD